MTRKDYQLIAEALFAAKPFGKVKGLDARTEQWQRDVEKIASALVRDNPRFDVDRFETACGF